MSGFALQTSQSDVDCDEDSESEIRIFIAALVPKLETIEVSPSAGFTIGNGGFQFFLSTGQGLARTTLAIDNYFLRIFSSFE